jgi:hypothetical protein
MEEHRRAMYELRAIALLGLQGPMLGGLGSMQSPQGLVGGSSPVTPAPHGENILLLLED